MQNSIILIVEAEPSGLDTLEQELCQRYQRQYQLVPATSGEEALAMLREFGQRNDRVALFLADQQLPGMSGIDFLVEARHVYPDAGRVLLTTYADAETAITDINTVGINHYLVKPWDPPEEKLYPILDELLADWRVMVHLPYMQVKDIMTTPVVARVRHTASLHHAAEIVALSGVGDLMVVDDVGNFVGVLSEGDILRSTLPDFDEILEEGGTLYEAFQLFMRKGRELSDKPIMPLVIGDPLVAHPDDHVAKAATLLINRQIRRLPVVKDGQLLGTVSRANICQAVVGTL
jgi:CBS domain-containing protein/ActR/RegA family two-component response regulator